jgi:hypothetical protein
MSLPPTDVSGLLTWRAVVEVEAPPTEVLSRLATENRRLDWDSEVTQWHSTIQLNKSTDVVDYTLSIAELNQPRQVCLIRLITGLLAVL